MVEERKNDSPLYEFLDIARTEYKTEREKKQSFESRAGFLFALIGAISTFLLKEEQLIDIFRLLNYQMSFFEVVKFMSGIAIYISFIGAIRSLVRLIAVRKQINFNVRVLNEDTISEKKDSVLRDITFAYCKIAGNMFDENEKRAKDMKYAMHYIEIMMITAVLYISI